MYWIETRTAIIVPREGHKNQADAESTARHLRKAQPGKPVIIAEKISGLQIPPLPDEKPQETELDAREHERASIATNRDQASKLRNDEA